MGKNVKKRGKLLQMCDQQATEKDTSQDSRILTVAYTLEHSLKFQNTV